MTVKKVAIVVVLSAMSFGLIACSNVGNQNISSVKGQPSAWVMTGSLNQKRQEFGDVTTNKMLVLNDGRAIAISGKLDWPLSFLPSSEIYNPQTGKWSYTGSLPSGYERDGFGAVTLPNGKILIAGGRNQDDLASSLLYDPETGRWSITGSLPWAADAVGVYLLNNGKVLACGGYNQYTKQYVSNCAVYDPQTENWTPAKNMLNSRQGHAGVVLPDGKVLMAGGASSDSEAGSAGALSASEIYDPEKDEWALTGSLNQARGYHLVVLLNNGKVLAAGGYQLGSIMQAISSSELYDPATGVWTMTGSLPEAKGRSVGLLLPDGRVLNTGGSTLGSNWNILASCAIYDPASEVWTPIASLNVPRRHHAIALLKDGRVLVAGGNNRETWDAKGRGLSSAELYDLGTIVPKAGITGE